MTQNKLFSQLLDYFKLQKCYYMLAHLLCLGLFFLVHTRMIRLRFLVLVASALPAVASVVVSSATTFGQQLIAICSLWCTSVMTHGANNMTTTICLKTEKFHKLISFYSPILVTTANWVAIPKQILGQGYLTSQRVN